MTVYNVDLGIGWASSGIEYAQKYRADIFKKINVDAKFIFSDMILGNNIEDLTKNIGFDDDQIIWLYNFFTDIKIAPSIYPLSKLEEDLGLNKQRGFIKKVVNDQVVYELKEQKLSIVARLHDKKAQTIDQVTYLRNNQILYRDFYSYTKYAREYYTGASEKNYVFAREFYNEDGSLAYTQHLSDEKEIFEFPNQKIFYSKNDFYRQMIKELHLTDHDVIIVDRIDEDKHLVNGQILFEEHKPAKLIVVVHADHYNLQYTTENNILWNNYYEYQLTNCDEVNAFVTATPKQQQLMHNQLKKYFEVDQQVDCVPVGNLAELRYPESSRKPFSLITASRLASEKHLDWLVKAVVEAKKQVPELTLDIYGKGEEAGKLKDLIKKEKAQDYIRLMGQYDLTNIYTKYSAYAATSTSEGFGLSLMEAVGSGLPMIGYDVPYGNPTFIDDGQNGYLLPYDSEMAEQKKCGEIRDAIIKLFNASDVSEFSKHSYEIAKKYLIDNVANAWKKELEEL